LKENETNDDALVEYAYALMDESFKPDYNESLSVLLRCLVKNQDNRRIKRLVSNLIKKCGPDLLIHNLTDASSGKLDNSATPAIAWIALIVKEHSGIEEAISLYNKCLDMQPQNTSYVLNLVHTLELKLDYEACWNQIKSYCSIAQIEPNEFIIMPQEFIRQLDLDWNNLETYRSGTKATEYSNSDVELTWIEDQGAQLFTKSSHLPVTSRTKTTKHANTYYDLLALYFTLVKILYVKGALSVLPAIIDILERARFKQELHETIIRNEHAYFCCISQIMTYLAPCLPLPKTTEQPLYVCGESHCLSPAWQTIELNGIKRTLIPVLVTGLKCWHLRPESDFYPKANFWNAVKTIPPKSKVIFMFGEIDCREGIWLAVEKCRYKDMDEGMLFAIRIYLNTLEQLLLEPYEFDIYVHPVLPVLDVTRQTVKRWNQLLEIEMNKRNANLKLLRFFDRLLTQDQRFLREELKLDGTHIHPRYVTLLEQALNERNL
jgi:tetratricopeptide (TPR) repeat protein